MNTSAYTYNQNQQAERVNLPTSMPPNSEYKNSKNEQTTHKNREVFSTSSQFTNFAGLELEDCQRMVDENKQTKDQKKKIDNQKQFEELGISNQQNELMNRFCYRIWGKHQILEKVTDFGAIFNEIKNKTNVKRVSLEFDSLRPIDYRGAVFKLQDLNQSALYYATLYLVQYLQQIQLRFSGLPEMPVVITCLIPRMQVPVVMGKEGKVIGKIRRVSNTHLEVDGPFEKYIHQTIQITGQKVEDVAKACFFLYRTVWKVLKRESIQFQLPSNSQKQTLIGLELPIKVQQQLFFPYEKYLNGLCSDLRVSVYLKSSLEYGNLILYSLGTPTHLIAFLSTNTLIEASILELIQFESMLQWTLKLMISAEQSRLITSLNGKILREISSKSEDCYMEAIIKECWDGESKLIVKGNATAKINCVRHVLRFLGNKDKIMSKQRLIKPIQHEKQIQQEKNFFKNGIITTQATFHTEPEKFKKTSKKKNKSNLYSKKVTTQNEEGEISY